MQYCKTVTLRTRPIKNGMLSFYLDYYPGYRDIVTMKTTRHESLGIYIYADPQNKREKEFNEIMTEKAEASESCPTRQDFFILLSWRISLRKCPQSVKQGCTDQGHLLRDGQTRNDRLHQSRMISAGVHALHLKSVHSSFVCPVTPLTSFFASALRVSKNYAHPKAELSEQREQSQTCLNFAES